jgi:hypothetical protein
VVTVHDARTCAERVFIAMELIAGLTIDQWLREAASNRARTGRGRFGCAPAVLDGAELLIATVSYDPLRAAPVPRPVRGPCDSRCVRRGPRAD